MRTAEPFQFPPVGPGWSPRWIAVSIVAHALAIALLMSARAAPPTEFAGGRPILLMDIPAQASEPARARPAPVVPRGPGPIRPLVVGPGLVAGELPLALPTPGGGTDSVGGGGPRPARSPDAR